ncbi:hypothetical protein NCAS_0D04160 [Naumovozyma castellii]|uniref:Uncharacterized protein n=1 Tax=Naumovozyma castellii TaxID=27288 RepID=G0VEK6_NAUCA|nr:hypothetical protein NCAS_0D04160 [Naumovozyma castellii CBS 4309]CCC69997.1 hypothetical protein NCAS_0D04160 [Naumovozyma castellii CBS 4309]
MKFAICLLLTIFADVEARLIPNNGRSPVFRIDSAIDGIDSGWQVGSTIATDKGNFIFFSSAEELPKLIPNYAGTDSMLVNTDTGFVITDIKNSETANSQSWNQWQLAKSGHWWSRWYPISPCFHTESESGSSSIDLDWSYNYQWSHTTGKDLPWGFVVATLGNNTTYLLERSGKDTCNIPGGSVGQVWYRQHLLWADYQKQDCTMSKMSGTTCSPWSSYIRVNAPLKDDDSNGYLVRCNTGKQNVQC